MPRLATKFKFRHIEHVIDVHRLLSHPTVCICILGIDRDNGSVGAFGSNDASLCLFRQNQGKEVNSTAHKSIPWRTAVSSRLRLNLADEVLQQLRLHMVCMWWFKKTENRSTANGHRRTGSSNWANAHETSKHLLLRHPRNRCCYADEGHDHDVLLGYCCCLLYLHVRLLLCTTAIPLRCCRRGCCGNRSCEEGRHESIRPCEERQEHNEHRVSAHARQQQRK